MTEKSGLKRVLEKDLRYIQREISISHEVDQPYRARLKRDRVDVWFRHLFPLVTLDMTFDDRIITETVREADILYDLQHPAIISAFGTTLTPEGPALILEPTSCSVGIAPYLSGGGKGGGGGVGHILESSSMVASTRRTRLNNIE